MTFKTTRQPTEVKAHKYEVFKTFEKLKGRSERGKWEAYKDYLRNKGLLSPALM